MKHQVPILIAIGTKIQTKGKFDVGLVEEQVSSEDSSKYSEEIRN